MSDPQPMLLGRGTYGPKRLRRLRGPMHLWNHVSMPPNQNSLIIYTDGSVREGNNFAPWEYDPLQTPNVHRYIYGGTKVLCDDLDDFSRAALLAAGYTCGFGATLDVYVSKYTDQYPQPAGSVGPTVAEAQEALRLERIALLEAELARLRGTT